ncbi:MAG: class I SAM-dependent methyltransferase [Pseudomonadota bacterium]
MITPLPSLMTCPLCGCQDVAAFATVVDPDHARHYHHCATCDLVFLDPSDRLDPARELAHYNTHENDVDDPGYRKFLARLGAPLMARLQPGAQVLDYGCGPGPALVALLNEAGHAARGYDPFYANDAALLDCRYDAVTCTETAEHFYAPGAEFARLFTLIESGGWVGLMTCEREATRPFATWHYRADPTHVCFYSAATFAWIAEAHAAALERPRKDVALFRKL